MSPQHPCPYEKYYSHQAGTGIGIVYKGVPHQRGHGIGSFLGGLFRSVLPLLSSGAKAVGKEALHTGVGILSDMIKSQPLEESVKQRLKMASANLKRKADSKVDSLMSGSGYKLKRLTQRPIIASKTSQRRGTKNKINKRKVNDIFS